MKVLNGPCSSEHVDREATRISDRNAQGRVSMEDKAVRWYETLAHMPKTFCSLSTASIYRIPLQAPATTAKQIKSNAIKLESVLFDVEVKHPLVSCKLSTCDLILSEYHRLPLK